MGDQNVKALIFLKLEEKPVHPHPHLALGILVLPGLIAAGLKFARR